MESRYEFHRLVDDRLKKVHMDHYTSLPGSDIDMIYNVIKDPIAALEFFSIGDVPDPEVFNGIVQYQNRKPGWYYKIEPQEFAGGLEIERDLFTTDRYDVMEKWAKGLAVAAKRKMNKMKHDPFVHMTSTAFDFLTTNEEGVALCSDSHLSRSGASTTTGFDNLVTTPFDSDALEAARLLGVKLRSDIGEMIDSNFDTILCPPDLEEDVYQVVESQYALDQLDRRVNFQKSKWKVIVLPYWSVHDTNDWAIVDSARAKEHLVWHEAVPLEFANTEDFDTIVRKYRNYFKVGWGYSDWKWIVGASVS